MNAVGLVLFGVLFIVMFVMVFCLLSPFHCGPSDVLTLKEKRKILNGEPKTTYTLDLQEVKIPIDKINFVEPFYKEGLLRGEIEDLNVIIRLNGKGIIFGVEETVIFPSLIRKNSGKMLLKPIYREFEANLQDIKEAKVLIRSGNTVIGETTIGIKIEEE